MGVYDSLYVKEICPNCHNEVEYCFKTKEFGLSYQEYHVGDYVAKANENYYLILKDDCPECGHETEKAFEIKNGQWTRTLSKEEYQNMKYRKRWYPYMTLYNDNVTIYNDIEVVHSELRVDNTVKVYFEQPVEFGFNYVECTIPDYKWEKNKGFNEVQLTFFNKFLHNNEELIMEFAAKGGFDGCKNSDNEDLKQIALMQKIKQIEKVITELPEEYIDTVENHLDYIIYKCTSDKK